MRSTQVHEAQMAKHLTKAIHHGSLSLFAQPKLHLASGRIVGAEVLLRVPQSAFLTVQKNSRLSDQKILISPISTDKWVQAAQNRGLMRPLSEWVIKEVFHHLGQSNFPKIPLAVNVPPSLLTPRFAHFLEACAEESGIPLSFLEIEITESQKPFNLKVINQTVQKLRAMGVKVMIDDFGSGYATMRYLVDVVVDAVKIDKDFVQKAATSQSAHLILKSLISLAKEMDVSVICEGVETMQQLSAVQELGCDVVQGFFISHPMRIDEFFNSRANSYPSIRIQ
ncbi:MAG: EAL domain-containing protein [Alphaproteobacteria bacterium]|nr:EAL domain-containing protein [Alphaproteobacteria bacterium]